MTIFETETCSRCCGSGSYSYCEMYGTTCFKCAGSGRMLTTRGRAALAWFRAQRSIPAGNVKPGMRVRPSGMKPFVVVEAFLETESRAKSLRDGVWVDCEPYFVLRGANTGLHTFANAMVEVLPLTKGDALMEQNAALAYQASLTKAGKPRKTRANIST